MDLKKSIVVVEDARNKTNKLLFDYIGWVKKLIPEFVSSMVLFGLFAYIFFNVYSSVGFEKTMVLFMVMVVVNAVRGQAPAH
jgi:hypothetical protein